MALINTIYIPIEMLVEHRFKD